MHRKKFLIAIAVLLLGGTVCAQGQGPFCGIVGTDVCTAVASSSSTITGWAVTCVVERGPYNIATANSPLVTFGTDADGIGAATAQTSNPYPVVSLGDGGRATLTFEEPISNGPGYDFAVFENSFSDTYLELAFVEVSSDGERFVRFPASSYTQTETQIHDGGHVDATNINNLAGKYRAGYGTPFDLAELADSVGLDISAVTHVRIVDVVGCIDPLYATYDKDGRIINDPYPTNGYSGGFDLDGVAVLSHDNVGVEQPAANTMVSVYPNPANDCLTVNVSGYSEARLLDVSGRTAMAFPVEGSTTVDVSHLHSGVYVLVVGSTTMKVVKM